MERLIITKMEYKGHLCRVTAQTREGQLIGLHLENPGRDAFLGSIHVGKVQRVLPNIRGAFVEIENRLPCFYPYTKDQRPIFTHEKKSAELKAGDELLVQVTQEALKLKAPCVSSNLSFQGKYLVLTTQNRQIGVSGKLPAGKREELRKLLKRVCADGCEFGVIVRTNAGEANPEHILSEFEALKSELEDTVHRGSFSPCYTRIRDGSDSLSAALKNVYWDGLEKIVTDDPDLYQMILKDTDSMEPKPACEIALYQDPLLPLHKLYRLEHGLEQALDERVWLKSGGFLIIQQTEACVVIDVNSGKNLSKGQADKEYKKINLEAAREIARQLRLRNLYGIILIDFINMNKYEDCSELLKAMRAFVREDRVTTTIVDVTALGIMELTRKKGEKSLREQVLEITGGDKK